jgi:hypothetical protein
VLPDTVRIRDTEPGRSVYRAGQFVCLLLSWAPSSNKSLLRPPSHHRLLSLVASSSALTHRRHDAKCQVPMHSLPTPTRTTTTVHTTPTALAASLGEALGVLLAAGFDRFDRSVESSPKGDTQPISHPTNQSFASPHTQSITLSFSLAHHQHSKHTPNPLTHRMLWRAASIMGMPLLFLLVPFLLLPSTTRALDNGLGLTPAMGWNSWNHFHCT